MLDLILEISQTLRNNRLRTVLTGSAVAWGVFMLIVLLGAARGVINSAESSMNKQDYNTIDIYNGVTTMPYKGYKSGRWIALKGSDRDALIADNKSLVSNVAVSASVDTAKIITPLYVTTDGFSAVFPNSERRDRLEMLYGRFLNDRDIEQNRRVMVLHESRAALHFGDAEKALGKTVKCMGLAWTVVGVYSNPWRKQAYVPYTTYKAVTGNDDNAYRLVVSVEGLQTEEDTDMASQAVRSTLAKTHSFDPQDKSAVSIWNNFRSYLSNLQANRMLKLAVWIIGILMLLTGIVGVSNIMFVSVRERTHEIGVRRAIGAKPRQILTQIIAESIGITALFGYIGVFFGMAVLQILDYFTKDVKGFSNPTVDITIALEVTVALMAAGALAGLFPARNAIKVKPVEALRDE